MTEQTEKIVKKFGDEDLSDVCLVVGNTEFHVHKQVLACQSKVFKFMFYGDFNEENSFEIDDADPLAFQRILEIIYNQELSDESFLRCRYSASNDAFWEQSTSLWKLMDRFDMTSCQKTFVKLFNTYPSQKTSSFLITRLPDEPKSFEAIAFMQKNNFSYRIRSNSILPNVQMSSSSGAEETRLAAEKLVNMSEPVEVEEEDTEKPPDAEESVENRLEVNEQLNEDMEAAQDPLNDQLENSVEGGLLDDSTTSDDHIPPDNDFPDMVDDVEETMNGSQRIIDDPDEDSVDSTLAKMDDTSMDEENGDDDEEKEEEESDEECEEEGGGSEHSDEEDEKNGNDAAYDEEDGPNSSKKHPKRVTYRLLFACPAKNCPISCKTFKRFSEHMKSHTNKENFFCDICKKDFSSKDLAITHIQGRMKKRCCACEKTFASCHVLLLHSRLHTSELPYGCGDCKKRFAQKSNLKTHELTHKDEKPFECGYCDRGFNYKKCLSDHERTHTGERPFSCRKCGKTYASSSALSTHNAKKHKLEEKKP